MAERLTEADRLKLMCDAAEMLWVVLASVSEGNWSKQSEEWQEAAIRWRDNYFAAKNALRAEAPSEPTAAPPKCKTCNDEGVIETAAAGAGHEDDLAEYAPCPDCRVPPPERATRTAEELRPKIVCLCGSTRFYEHFQEANYRETMAGNIVLSVGFYPHAQKEVHHSEGVGCTPDQKIKLDELHKKKIDLADEVLVLNVGGYIGSSTRSEIEHAQRTGKPIRYLEATLQPGETR